MKWIEISRHSMFRLATMLTGAAIIAAITSCDAGHAPTPPKTPETRTPAPTPPASMKETELKAAPATQPASQPSINLSHFPRIPATGSPGAASQPDFYNVPFKPIPIVEKRGSGPVNMVLIPDLTCDWSVFDEFMSRNVEHFTMYAVTLPGFGGTEPPVKPLDAVMGPWLDNAVTAVWTMIQEKSLSKPVIVGLKLGGHMALRLGIEHPGEVRAVVSIDGWPAMPLGITDLDLRHRKETVLQFWTVYKMMSEEDWLRQVSDQLGWLMTDQNRAKELAEVCRKTPRDVGLQYTVDQFSYDISAPLAKSTTPSLVLAAVPTRDLIPSQVRDYYENWNAALQNTAAVKLVFFENTRPYIQFDRPAELDAAIADFLAGREVKGIIDDSPRPAPPPADAPTTAPAASP